MIKDIKVDEEDLSLLKKYTWYFYGKYPMCFINKKTHYLHNLILGKKVGYQVDHINHDRLDNRRKNLRYATVSQNQANAKKQVNNTSGFKGVSAVKRKNGIKWRAYIQKDGVWQHIGYFNSKEEAVLAYEEKALMLFGEYAMIKRTGNIA